MTLPLWDCLLLALAGARTYRSIPILLKTTLEEDQVSEVDLDRRNDHVRAMALHFGEKLLHAGDFQEAFRIHVEYFQY